MNRSVISQRISSILDEIQRLNNELYAMNTTDIQRYPDNYEVLSVDAALKAERIACRLRHLIYASTSRNKDLYLTAAAEMQDVRIKQGDGIVQITLPCIMPNRKQWKSTEYLLDPLHYALAEYVRRNPVPRYRHPVVCFIHMYKEDLPTRRIRDYDNFELKQYLDVVASFLMTDDGGLYCDAYQTTELGEKDCTLLFLMEDTQFPLWLMDRQSVQ